MRSQKIEERTGWPRCIWKKAVKTTTIVLRPFVCDYLGEPVPEETLTHLPSWSSNLDQLLPSTTIHSILLVQITCLAVFLHNLSPCPLWSASWSGALHLIFYTCLDHPISVVFLQHMPIPSQPVLLEHQEYVRPWKQKWRYLFMATEVITQLECGPMPNVMAALPNIGGALSSMPQSLADGHYHSALQ